MTHHLAQVNIARFRLPQDHPVNEDFINALDEINALAETQDGFVWRLVGDGNNAVDIQPFEDPQMGINMSVWHYETPKRMVRPYGYLYGTMVDTYWLYTDGRRRQR